MIKHQNEEMLRRCVLKKMIARITKYVLHSTIVFLVPFVVAGFIEAVGCSLIWKEIDTNLDGINISSLANFARDASNLYVSLQVR
jgi:hypothetical protein